MTDVEALKHSMSQMGYMVKMQRKTGCVKGDG